MSNQSRWPAALALFGAVLGIVFAAYSTYDYTNHLDRQLHEVHCSFVPGITTQDANSGCRTAMYSAYGAMFRGVWWGGIPVALLGLGTYLFYAGFATSLVAGGYRASRRAYQFFGYSSLLPLLASVVMAYLAATKLGVFCKTCIGMYIASILLAIGGIAGLFAIRKVSFAFPTGTGPTGTLVDPPASSREPQGMPLGHPALIVIWLAALGLTVALPALVYVTTLPDYRSKLGTCGTVELEGSEALVNIATLHPKRDVLLVADPLCPTCKGLHQRLESEGVLENSKLTIALLPLDNSCNWMLDRPVHPGSCVLTSAIICADKNARQALDWMYANQDDLAAAGKAGDAAVKAKLRGHFGADIEKCIDSKQTQAKLNSILQFAVKNRLSVSTPQMFLGKQRVCDEDTDLGLRFTLTQLAPELLQ